MKRQFLGIFFYLLYLLAMVRPVMPIIEYYANYEYIATVLCENKDKPYLECNGKCYLSKELQETKNTDSEKILNTKNFDLVFYSNIAYEIETPNVIKTKVKLIYIEFHHSEPYLEVLVPPPMLSADLENA